jgi:hypothetical protein
MAAKAHAILSASSSVGGCTAASARLWKPMRIKEAKRCGRYRRPCAWRIQISPSWTSRTKTRLKPQMVFREMENCASGYAEYVLEQVRCARKHAATGRPDRQRVDLSRW